MCERPNHAATAKKNLCVRRGASAFAVIIPIVISIIALFQSNGANQTANEAMRRSSIPWLKAEAFELENSAKYGFRLNFVVKNYSDSPALDFNFDIVLTDKEIEPNTVHCSDGVVVMPNSSESVFVVPGGRLSEEMALALKEKKAVIPYRLTLRFKDISNKAYVVHQVGIVGDTLQQLGSYRIDGI